MSSESMRTHVIIPRELLETIDGLVGKRARSRFLAEAAAEKLRRERVSRSIKRVAGSLKDVDIPGWESSEAAAEWVRSSRRADQEQVDRESDT
jgi:metal-responsive CopG/Arc/MetJ family transcriptional regulator